LTSYGWQNAYTHGDPSLISALLATGDPAVRVFTPADPHRTALALDAALSSTGKLNVVIAGKHQTTHHPLEGITEEESRGLAIWSHFSDAGEPDVTLVCAGDLPAEVVRRAAPVIRDRHRCAVRIVNVHELTALRDPRLEQVFGLHAAVVVATLGHPAAVWGLLAGHLDRPCEVIGWREPPAPMRQIELAAFTGLDVDGIVTAAGRLLHHRIQR
jgi:xylulose-5-phosphate/fructose-6-phosphate phosphoketolase